MADCRRQPPLPDRPTHHLPGTRAKVEVMAARLRAGRHLHHPQDARLPGGEDLATLLPGGDCPVLVPAYAANHKLLGLSVMSEADYRAAPRRERHWDRDAAADGPES